MNCTYYRRHASAALDDEEVAGEDLDAHRASCAACAAWQRDIETLARRTRVRPADPVPGDLVTEVLADIALPDQRLRRRITALRIVLAVIGVVQLAIAVPALFDADMGMAMSVHASHESAAWNLAVGLAVLFVAWRPLRVAGALAAIGTFVAVLTVLSVIDVVRGAVGVDRLVTHVGVILAALALVALQRIERGLPLLIPTDPLARPTESATAYDTASTPAADRATGRDRPALFRRHDDVA